MDDDDLLQYDESEDVRYRMKLFYILSENPPPYSLTMSDVKIAEESLDRMHKQLQIAKKTAALSEATLLGIDEQSFEEQDSNETLGISHFADIKISQSEECMENTATFDQSDFILLDNERIPIKQNPSDVVQAVFMKEKVEDTDDDVILVDETTSDNESSAEPEDSDDDDEYSVPHVSFKKFLHGYPKGSLIFKKPTDYLNVDFDGRQPEQPFGVVFDEISKFWAVVDLNHRIFLLDTENGKKIVPNGRALKDKLLRYPTALTILKEGHSMAILCSRREKNDHYIVKFKYTRKTQSFEHYTLSKNAIVGGGINCRGLAMTKNGAVVTIGLPRDERPKLIFVRKDGLEHSYQIRGADRPSFIASKGTKVAVTDLGVQKVFLLNVIDKNWSEFVDEHSQCIQVIKVIDNRDSPILRPRVICDTPFLKYVAGVQFDDDENLLIGDAGGSCLKFYDKNLKFEARASTTFPIPFMSSFFVNRRGSMLLIDYRNPNHKLVYATLHGTAKPTEFIEAGIPPKMASRSVFSNRR